MTSLKNRFFSARCLALAATALAFCAESVADTVFAVSFNTGELITYNSADPINTRTTLLPAGSIVSPGSIAVGPDGNLYIGELGDGSTFAPRISKFEPATLTLSTVFAFGAFDVFPGSLVFKGNDLLIGRDPHFLNTGSIIKLSNATGGALAVSDYTTGASLASSPGLALTSNGQLYLSNQTNDLINSTASGPVLRFDAAGAFLGEVIADGASGLAGPSGLAIDGTTLYTANVMDGAILQTDLTTDTTTPFATTGASFEAGALAVLSDGSLIVGSTSGNGNIYHFGPDGSLLSTFASGLGNVGGIAVIPEPSALPLLISAMAAICGQLIRRHRSVKRDIA